MNKIKSICKQLTVHKICINSNMKLFLTLVIMSCFSVGFQALMQNGRVIWGYISYITSPIIILFNFIPIFCLMLFVFGITNSIRTSFVVTNIPLSVFLIINEFKILFRDEPFKPSDFSLIGEATNMLENYTISVSPKVIIMTLIMILSIVFVIVFIRNTKFDWGKRIFNIAISLAIFLPALFFGYKNYDVYESVRIKGNIYHESNVFANKGFIYSFLSTMTGLTYQKPEGYSADKAEEILSEYPVSDDEKLPNVIAIMSEAFFDLQQAENLEFVPGMNPLEKLNQIRESSMYGYIFVPGFAGGTSHTEFEFLCASNISLIDSSMPTVYKSYINSDTYGLAAEFKSNGYETVAIHPGHPWFYNRLNVYKYMGFDEFITAQDLPEDVEKTNYYISDSVLSELIINSYEKHLKENPDKGYFNHNVTIQNHGPYPQKSSRKPARIVHPAGMSNSDYNILENYASNLYDAVQLLDEVIKYTDSIDVPTVVVFFGDHLPYLDSEYNDYQTIGYNISGSDAESVIRQHSTPFIIRGNEAFTKSFPQAKGGDAGLISSNFLAAKMLEYIGADMSPYMRFVKELSRDVSVIANDFYIENGVFEDNASEELQKKLKDYQILQYYNINDYKLNK